MKQVPLDLAPAPLATFDAFLPGPNAAVLAQVRGEVPPRAPLYLWGERGCGKTFLLQALAQACQMQGLQVAHFDAGAPPVSGFDPGWALLVLDDVHTYGVDAQHAAFALLVEAQTHGVPWAAAGSHPPVDLPLREDLRTRIGWGTVHALETLDEHQARAVVRREADRRGMALTDEVLDYLLNRHARDLKFLMRWLDRMDAFALSHQRGVTVPLVRQMLAEREGAAP